MSSNPSKTSGKLHEVTGGIKENIGEMAGAESLQTSGRQQRTQGEGEYKAAQAQGYAEGTKDRAGGYKDSILGAVTGDKSQQASGNTRNEKGKVQQDIN